MDKHGYVFCVNCGRRRERCVMSVCRSVDLYLCIDHVDCDEAVERMRTTIEVEFPPCCFMCPLHYEPGGDIDAALCEMLNMKINDMPDGKCPPDMCPLRKIGKEEDILGDEDD